MRGRRLLSLALLACGATVGQAPDATQDFSRVGGVRTVLDAKIPMRDGVKLSANIYFPEGSGPFPVVLVRTPYDNTPLAEAGAVYAKRGYVYVAQDCRGRYDSEGVFYAWHSDVADGYDTRKWIAQQPWSNGKIGTVGGSYLGMVQWLGVIEGSENLTAMVPSSTPIDGWIWGNQYVNGAYQLALSQEWAVGTSARSRQPSAHYDWLKLLRHLPLVDMIRVSTGRDIPFARDWLQHPNYDEYWRKISVEDKFDRIQVPIYSLDGWFDAYPSATFRGFKGVQTHAKSDTVRKGQRVIMGPWPHGLNRSTKTGELDFGPDAMLSFSGVPEQFANDLQLNMSLRWFDYWLKGIDNGIMKEPPIRLFVMGANVWRSEQEWPLARTQFTKYYLHSDGKANSLGGDGTLSTSVAGGKVNRDTYTYDPNDPVYELGGNFSFTLRNAEGPIVQAGPFDQRPNEKRNDILVYRSEPLADDLEVTGPLTCQLYISSTAPDTDVVVKLVNVYPDGRAFNFSEGILRVRFRGSKESPALMEPGKVYPLTIEMQPTSLVFKKGHRIQIDITSSDFPHYDRNPNTGRPFGLDSEMQTAQQTVFHDGQYPSHIVLPVIPSARNVESKKRDMK